ncbi:MAG: ABC transporter permease subunit [Deltaproteobacteria bacterium]|jgi:ABC-type nitrate/sulfonate/bicarbonate transport system permease component|nr:ABC transporter permease subunit [Deltaproteobacteria bacterium]
MSTLLPYLVSGLALAGLAAFANLMLGPELAPSPLATLSAFAELGRSGELFRELAITLGRGALGIFLANIAGFSLGMAAGLIPGALRLLSPLVAAFQACPPILWISLVMVWAGTGSVVPVAAVFAATFPFVFSTTAQGVLGLDRRILAMSRLYAVPKSRIFRLVVLPGVFPYWLAGFSTVLAAGWKAAAVAEFLGSHQGIGARIFWNYHKLNMEQLNAWALVLILLGVALECGVVVPLRRKAAQAGLKDVSSGA